MEFLVTKKHIEDARRNHRSKCPVANSMKEELRGRIVEVGSTYAIIDGHEYAMDNATIKAVEKYDKTSKMQPFYAVFSKV